MSPIRYSSSFRGVEPRQRGIADLTRVATASLFLRLFALPLGKFAVVRPCNTTQTQCHPEEVLHFAFKLSLVTYFRGVRGWPTDSEPPALLPGGLAVLILLPYGAI